MAPLLATAASMPTTPIAYRVISGDTEEWFEDSAAADAVVARLLGVTGDRVGALGRPITVDPVVVRRRDGRWRSRKAWSFRSNSSVVRVFEMLRVDEALYEH